MVLCQERNWIIIIYIRNVKYRTQMRNSVFIQEYKKVIKHF